MTDTPPNKALRDATVEISDGRLIGMAEFGDPDGKPVFWFHATPGGRHQLPPDAPEEARKRGIRLIGIERPGTGRSSPHMYHRLVEWAADVSDVANALGIGQFAVVGLSGGGPYVLACAHELPDRIVAAAVLGGVGPVRGPEFAPGPSHMLRYFARILGAVAEPGGELFSKLLRSVVRYSEGAFELFTKIAPEPDKPVLARPEFRAAFLYDLTTSIEGGTAAAIHDMALLARHWGFALADISIPVRFWHGDVDGIVPVSHGYHQSALVPDSELVVVPGGGHFSGYETIEEVLDTILGLWPATGPDKGGVVEKAPAKKAPAKKAPAKKAPAKKAPSGNE